MDSLPAPAPLLPPRPHDRLRRRLVMPLVALAAFLAIVGVARAVEGGLSFKERAPAFSIGGATGVVASPDGKFVYATHADSLTVLARDAASGELTWVETEHDDADDPSDPGPLVNGLNSATSVAISADGATVYATGFQSDNSVAVFERDPATGRLNYLEVERDGVDDPSDPGGPVFDMFRPEAIVVSPDGASVYVLTGNGGNSLVVFDRDPANGRLSYVETEREGFDDPDDPGGTVDGIYWGMALAISADGGSVYASSTSEAKVAAFDRDPASGELSFVEIEQDGVEDPGDGVGVVDGLSRPEAIVGSPDGDFVYVAGYFDNGVAVFKRDPGTSELIFVEVERDGVDDPGDPGGTVAGLQGPRDVAVSPGGANVYVAGGGEVATFRFLPGSGEIAFVGSESVGSPALDHLLLTPDGSRAYVAGEEISGLAVLARAGAGAPAFGALELEFVTPVLEVGGAIDAALSPDGRHLVTGAYERLRVFSRDPGSGSIVAQVDQERSGVDDPSDPAGELESFYEPKAIAFAPDGELVYVADGSSAAIHVFDLDPVSGELSWLESEFDGADDPGDSGAEVDELGEPEDIALSPDGKALYAAGGYDESLVAFDRDPATGRLSFKAAEVEGVGGVEGLSKPTTLAISPDGRGIVVGNDESAEEVGVFARDPATNEVQYLEVERAGVDDPGDPSGPVEGLDGYRLNDVLVGGAGSVFVAGDEGLVRFQRDATTGLLSFAEWEREGFDDPADPGAAVTGLSGAQRLALSNGGSQLYVASEGWDAPNYDLGALVVFDVAPGSGALSYLETELGGIDDPGDGGPSPRALSEPSGLMVSPDDRFVYVASEGERGLAIFERELAPVPPAAPTPIAAPAPSEADERLEGGVLKTARKQRQRGSAIVVTLTAKAAERATVTAWGKVRVGKRSYKLKQAKRTLRPGQAAKLKLRPAKAAQRKKIAAALRDGANVRATVTARIADPAGNQLRRKLAVRLLAPPR